MFGPTFNYPYDHLSDFNQMHPVSTQRLNRRHQLILLYHRTFPHLGLRQRLVGCILSSVVALSLRDIKLLPMDIPSDLHIPILRGLGFSLRPLSRLSSHAG